MLQQELAKHRKRRVTVVPDAQVIAYIRVSTDEQAASGAGLAAQRHALAAEAERRGFLQFERHIKAILVRRPEVPLRQDAFHLSRLAHSDNAI